MFMFSSNFKCLFSLDTPKYHRKIITTKNWLSIIRFVYFFYTKKCDNKKQINMIVKQIHSLLRLESEIKEGNAEKKVRFAKNKLIYIRHV